MRYVLYFFLLTRFFPAGGQSVNTAQTVATGHLPVVVADAKGTIHLVYGQDSTIYYATASAATTPFSNPLAVATLPGLVAGAKRGPQLAVTSQFVVITAVDKTGNVVAYSLDRRANHWSPATRINDVPEMAKEGFQAVAGASDGTFNAAWLDLRDDRQNKIVSATSVDGGRTWLANQIVYRSPGGTVCECCRVSMVANGKDVYIQFRNSLGGSRDLFLIHSVDGGKTYAVAQKLGVGTWKLNACPMDGGAVTLATTWQPLTVWRRENTLYTCVFGQPEQAVGTGRNVTAVSGVPGTALAWDKDGAVWLKLNGNEPISPGRGQMPGVALAGHSAVCVWEADGQVMTATIPF
jgi:hypothetical protein